MSAASSRKPPSASGGVHAAIAAGKIADLVILDGNPLDVPPDRIRDIRVVETIKRGKTIHRVRA